MNLCVRRNAFLVVFGLLSAAGALSAQVGFSLPFVNNATPGSPLNAPVQVTGFNNIAGVQYVISWDPQVLSFLTIDNFNLPGLDAAEFNSSQAAASGILRFAWVSDNLNTGTTKPDGTTIFRIRFQVLGAVNSSTPITITQNPPTGFEVNQIVGGNLQALGIDQVQLTQGFAAVGFTVGVAEVSNDPEWSVSIVPNPFSDTAQIIFENKEDADIQAIITDVAGKMILEKKFFSSTSGQHGMEIASSQLHEKGMYFLILRTDKRSCVRPLFLF
jgi:hypothetical protein